MSDFPRTLPETIPADKNRNPVSLMSGWDSINKKAVPLALIELGDGTFALKTVSETTITPVILASASAITPVSVGSTPTLVLPANVDRKGHQLFNAGNATIYVGATNSISVADGIPIAAGATFDLDLRNAVYTGDIYIVTASGETSEIRGITYL